MSICNCIKYLATQGSLNAWAFPAHNMQLNDNSIEQHIWYVPNGAALFEWESKKVSNNTVYPMYSVNDSQFTSIGRNPACFGARFEGSCSFFTARRQMNKRANVSIPSPYSGAYPITYFSRRPGTEHSREGFLGTSLTETIPEKRRVVRFAGF